jgi:ParB-like chromosome segregation protein Spo0J
MAALKSIELEYADTGRAPNSSAVPVVVIPPDMDPASVNMTENGQREEVDYISKANGAATRINAGMAAGRSKAEVVKDVAEDMNTTPGVVHVYLSMLTLRPEIQKRAAAGEIPYRLLRVLPDLTEEQQDAALVDLENVSKGLSTVEQVADKAAKGKVKKNKKGQGRKKRQDSAEGPAAISSKKALLLMDEAAAEIDALAKADNVTAEQKAACKDAKSLLKVFAKVLAGSMGAQALGRQLIKRMEEE